MARRYTHNFPRIPGLPGGWTVHLFGQSEREPRQAVVVCQRARDDTQADSDWVCWRVNMVEGGCHIGHYKHSAREAELVFEERFRELERMDTPAGRA
jgi:hypothetical protein